MIKYKANSPELDELGLPPESFYKGVKSESEIIPTICSFCFKPLDVSVATHGTLNPRTSLKIEATIIQEDPQVVRIDRKMVFSSTKVVACPACCLMIKPVMEKCPTCRGRSDLKATCKGCKGSGETGKVLSQGVKFPQTAG